MALALSSFRLPTQQATASIRWVDLCGALLSGLCAVHCAVTPVLVGVLPTLAGEGAESGLRRTLLALGLLGVGLGTLLHRDRRALVPFAGGVLLAGLLEVGAVVPVWEVFVSLAISALLIAAHALNTRACNAHCHACAPARFWTSQVEGWGTSKFGAGLLALAAALLVHASVFAAAVRVEPRPPAIGVRLAAAPRTIEVDLAASTWPSPAAMRDFPVVTPAEVTSAPPVHTQVSHPDRARPAAGGGAAGGGPAGGAKGDPGAAASAGAPTEGPAVFADVLSAAEGPVSFDRVLNATPGLASQRGAGAEGPVSARSDGAGANASAARDRQDAGGPLPAAELSRRPAQPPHLGSLIQARYPAAARAEQVSGVGRARLLVSREGVVVQAQPLAETPSASGFAQACVDALQGSRGWGEPLDARGRPTSTWIRFSCEFSIRH